MIDTPMMIAPPIDTPFIEEDAPDPQRPYSTVPGSTVPMVRNAHETPVGTTIDEA